MECKCGNKNAVRWKTGFFLNEKGERERYEACDKCTEMGSVGFADVFWDGSPEHGLPDNPQTGQPYTFGSRAEKAAFLKANQLREAGDRVHGSMIHTVRDSGVSENYRESRQMVEKALSHVRLMGSERRKEEYLKIRKEAMVRQ